MNKNIFRAAAIAAFAAVSLTACDKSKNADEAAAPAQNAPAELKIAYVEVDSIMTQYQFCKDYTQILTKKGQNIEATIQQKGQALQTAANNFQQKIQQNAYTREQAEAIQAGLQKQNADLQALQQRLGTEFQQEQEKYNIALHDSIANYLKKYNKEKKYSIIFSKSGDNLLYADKAYDVTNEVIAGLNKAYKPAPATKKQDKKK
ncbi:MAG: OmpH family outer membrane protein [Prevotella sp.]|nr:OmpH family outer membrane protein [Prevotella sp.]